MAAWAWIGWFEFTAGVQSSQRVENIYFVGKEGVDSKTLLQINRRKISDKAKAEKLLQYKVWREPNALRSPM